MNILRSSLSKSETKINWITRIAAPLPVAGGAPRERLTRNQNGRLFVATRVRDCTLCQIVKES